MHAFRGGALLALLAGSLAGSVIGYGHIKATNRDPSDYELPFGTFISAWRRGRWGGGRMLPMRGAVPVGEA
jgi:hypothetical protein